MTQARPSRRRRIFAVTLLVPLIILVVMAFNIANQAGALPWQEDPTPIPVTPFGNLPGSGDAGVVATPGQ
jgi:hypothetical protein